MCDFCIDNEGISNISTLKTRLGNSFGSFIETNVHLDFSVVKHPTLVISQYIFEQLIEESETIVNYCPVCGRLLTEEGSIRNLSSVKKFDYEKMDGISLGEVLKNANIHCDNSSSCDSCDLEECCPMNICSDLLLQKLRLGETKESE